MSLQLVNLNHTGIGDLNPYTMGLPAGLKLINSMLVLWSADHV